jgi:hypothetical protein
LWISTNSCTSTNPIANNIVASRDGINWYEIAGYAYRNTNLTIVKWIGNKWFSGVWFGSAPMLYSYDGFTWMKINDKGMFPSNIETYAYNGSIYVAGGNGNTTNYSLAYSYDGINWTGIYNSLNTFGYVHNIVTNVKIFVANFNYYYYLFFSNFFIIFFFNFYFK